MKNFHLPLPDRTYEELSAEAKRTRRPATAMAREAIGLWLRARRKTARHRAIAAYAERFAGTELDLNPALEQAAVEMLLRETQEKP